jgi:hypothetical protein
MHCKSDNTIISLSDTYSHKFFDFIVANLLLLTVNLFGFYLFGKMAEDVIEEELIIAVDRWISVHISAVQTPLLNDVMILLTQMNGLTGISLFSLVVMAVLFYKRWFADLVLYLFGVDLTIS